MHLRISEFNVNYSRGGSTKSAVYDELTINVNTPTTLPLNTRLNIDSILNKKLRPYEPDRIIPEEPTEVNNQILAIQQSTIERLEALSEDLIKKNAEFRLKLELDYNEKIKTLEQEFKSKDSSLDNEHKSRLGEISEQHKELVEKIKYVDDRENKHARRATRDKMLEDVKSRIKDFGVSKATSNKRVPLLIGLIVLFLSFICLFLFTSNEIMNISANQPSNYIFWLKLSLYSFGAMGTLLYYIRWQNKWAEQHANSEFQLQQFYIDVNRANWVIESCLEWEKEAQKPMPTELLESITNRLFINIQAEPERVIHPSDELASALMGSASNLQLKIGENQLDINKPSKTLPKSIYT
jgi:hypothetical protein